MNKKHPHILFLCSDQHSPFVSGYAGDPHIRTPNLDRLAERGVVYDNHYTANPVCLPGRFSMLSGLLPREMGTCYFLDQLPEDTQTYMRHFSQHGYMTTCVGKMHFLGPEQMYGWQFRPFGDMQTMREYVKGYSKGKDIYDGDNAPLFDRGIDASYNAYMLITARAGNDQFMVFDESVTRESVNAIKDWFTDYMNNCTVKTDQPLLLESSFITPHCPFVAPPELFNHYKRVVGMPTKGRKKDAPPQIEARFERDEPSDKITEDMILNARAGYYGLVQWMDQQLGIILDTLEQMGVLDDFIIVYTSDHGELIGEHGLWQKSCYYEASARVPMIIAGGDFPKGIRVEDNTSHIDLLPTLCDIANLPQLECRGQSMLPLMSNPKMSDRVIYSEDYGRMEWDFEKEVVPLNLMAKQGHLKYTQYKDGAEELYDLEKDPDELENLITDDSNKSKTDFLKQQVSNLPAPWRHQSQA